MKMFLTFYTYSVIISLENGGNMKKFVIMMILFIVFLFPSYVSAQQNVNLYLFYGEECPVCEKERQFLSELQKKHPELNIYRYEVWHNPENSKLLEEIGTILDETITGVPFTVVGDTPLRGFSDAIGNYIEKLVEQYQTVSYDDKVGRHLQVETALENKEETEIFPTTETNSSVRSSSFMIKKRDVVFLSIILILLILFGILLFRSTRSIKKDRSL